MHWSVPAVAHSGWSHLLVVVVVEVFVVVASGVGNVTVVVAC